MTVRSSLQLLFGASVSEELATALRVRLEVASVHRDARHPVFDQDARSVAVDLRWQATDSASIYAGHGWHWATSRPRSARTILITPNTPLPRRAPPTMPFG